MGIISGPGSFAVQFGDHLRSWDHLRTRTDLLGIQRLHAESSSYAYAVLLKTGSLDNAIREFSLA